MRLHFLLEREVGKKKDSDRLRQPEHADQHRQPQL